MSVINLSLVESIKKQLVKLKEEKNSWKGGKEKLSKNFNFKNFKDAIEFVNEVARVAEKQNHHPSIEINYNKVHLTITDHEKGEVSEKCHKLINAINKINSPTKGIDENKTEKFITCKNCRHKFTQTIHKGKKSIPVCPHCGTHNTEKKKTETKEQEIQERCWKGYTQRGMKTMFGKKYPNCVKVKK